MNMRYTDINNGTMSSKFLRSVARSLRHAIEEAEEEGRFSYAQTLRVRVTYIEHELRARSRGVADHLQGRTNGSFWDSPLASRICGVPWQPKEVLADNLSVPSSFVDNTISDSDNFPGAGEQLKPLSIMEEWTEHCRDSLVSFTNWANTELKRTRKD